MMTTSDILRMLAQHEDSYIVLDLAGMPRLVIKDGKGNEIGTLPQAHFDNLCGQSFLERVDGKWRLSDAAKAAVSRASGAPRAP